MALQRFFSVVAAFCFSNVHDLDHQNAYTKKAQNDRIEFYRPLQSRL